MKIFIISLLIHLSMIECNDFEDAVHELEHLMKPARNTCSALEKKQCRGTCRIKSQEYCDEQNRNCYFDAKPVCRTKNKHKSLVSYQNRFKVIIVIIICLLKGIRAMTLNRKILSMIFKRPTKLDLESVMTSELDINKKIITQSYKLYLELLSQVQF